MYIYVYTYMYIYVCVYVYIYICCSLCISMDNDVGLDCHNIANINELTTDPSLTVLTLLFA